MDSRRRPSAVQATLILSPLPGDSRLARKDISLGACEVSRDA